MGVLVGEQHRAWARAEPARRPPVPSSKIVIATDRPPQEVLDGLWRRIASAWPPAEDAGDGEDGGDPVPGVGVEPLSAVLEPATADAPRVVLVIVDPADPFADVSRRLNAILESRDAGLVLFAPGDRRADIWRGLGLVIETEDADPTILAAMLRALSARQPAIREMALELSVLSSQRNGARDRIEQLNDELQLASIIQREFLPASLPLLERAELGVLFRPAGHVSGDIYDVRTIDEAHVGILLADAVGHGVPAALLTIVISRALAVAQTVDGKPVPVPPWTVMARLNQSLLEHQDTIPRFATGVYALLDTRTMGLTIANAGHPPPLCVRGDRVDRVQTTGPLLGVFPDAVYEQTHLALEPGQTLVIFSDGFETAFPDENTQSGRPRPSERYIKHLTDLGRRIECKTETMSAAMDRLASLIDRQVGSLNQADDVTALAISAFGRAKSAALRAA